MHVAWEYSTDQSGGFPDLNTRYNFYDFSTGEWNWIDPDYMQSGVNVFTRRTAMGRLSVDPNTGNAHVSGHYLPRTGMEERELTAYSRQPTASFARDVIWLGPDLGHDPDSPSGIGSCPASLLDITGRKVMELQPGDNDIRRLSPGVYFVREEGPRGRGSEGPSGPKIVIQR